jgi:SAM-dependent methyltransferase
VAQLEFAKNQALRKKAHFQIGDAMKLPFEADEFDVSAMALVILFVPDPAKGVGEMKRVVRSGGLVAAYAWDIFGGGFPLEPVPAVLRSQGIEYPLPPSAEVSRMVNLESLWKTAGLSSVEVCEINGERKFEGFEDFWNLTSSSTALKPVWKNLDSLALLDVKNATRKNLKVKTEEKLILLSWANAIKGTV